MSRTVQCFKLKQELPGLDFVPFDDDLGERIYNEISAEAWRQWIEYSKRLINEYRLDLVTPEAFHMLHKKCDEFLFTDSAAAEPAMYKPADEHKH
ncbi:MAG: oxidative damage protection protein [Myxococcales bacterium]|nr:oxidative damage protection protein [Myxococcales bacterium]